MTKQHDEESIFLGEDARRLLLQHPPMTSKRIKCLANEGWRDPKMLTIVEIQDICGCLLAHIARAERA